jgi:fatty acid elongase 3
MCAVRSRPLLRRQDGAPAALPPRCCRTRATWGCRSARPANPASLRPAAVHNAFLALLSSCLLAGLLLELGREAAKVAPEGAFRTAVVFLCDPAPHVLRSGRLYFLYYLNYLTKYVELSDTLLLCLRGKALPFLHVYHHAATMVLCWTQLASKPSMQWIPIVLNLMVHVPMYYYYAVATFGYSPWWKKHLTTAQIVQFCLDVPATALATTLKMNAVFAWGWFGGANTDCACDSLPAAYFGTGLLLSYLFLFINFFIKTYKQGVARRRAKAAAKKSS